MLLCFLSHGVDMESVRGLLYLMSAICVRGKSFFLLFMLVISLKEQHSTSALENVSKKI